MTMVANSHTALANNKRVGSDGFNTLFFGTSRFQQLTEGEVPKGKGVLYPVAFLVEREPGARLGSHFHQAEQIQVVVGGSGMFGLHEVSGVMVHYTGPYTAYGPLLAFDKGLDWFTLRNAWDAGAQFMPQSRELMRAGRKEYAHREAVADVPDVMGEAELAGLSGVSEEKLIAPAEDGVAAWRYRLAPGAVATGPEPGTGGGQYWVVLSGSMRAVDDELLPAKSCVFVTPEDAALAPTGGPGGAEVLCMQFARRPTH